jgi:hypothetical protein
VPASRLHRPVRTPRPRASLKRMAVPEGSCSGTGEQAIPGSEDFDRSGLLTGVCAVCHGRFRLSDGLLPNHAPSLHRAAVEQSGRPPTSP